MTVNIDVLASSSAGNAYIIGDGKTKLLLECGIPIAKLQKRSRFTLSQCAACLLSHQHGDHSKAWRDVTRYMPIYMLADTAYALGASGHKIKTFLELEAFTVGTFSITPIPAAHDVPCAAFIIYSMETFETLLFVTDCAYLRHRVYAAHYAMVECNYQQEIIDEAVNSGKLDDRARRRIMQTHTELKTTEKILSDLDSAFLKAIYIIHTSSRNSDVNAIKTEIQQYTGKPVYIAKA